MLTRNNESSLCSSELYSEEFDEVSQFGNDVPVLVEKIISFITIAA